MVDLRVTLVGGKAHSVDSSDAAFQMAGSLALKEAAAAAGVALLEPVDEVQIVVDDEYVGDVMGDVSGVGPGDRHHVRGRRADPGRGRGPGDRADPVRADLRGLAHGSGIFTRTYLRHAPMPRSRPSRCSRPAPDRRIVRHQSVSDTRIYGQIPFTRRTLDRGIHDARIGEPEFVLAPRRTSTPQRLFLATVTVVLAGVLGGALGWQGFSLRAEGLERSRAEATHQNRLQIIRTKAVIADAAATDDVLRGTAPKPIAGRAFDYALSPAVTGLVVAARQPQDAARLAIANRWLSRYTQLVDTARTSARTGNETAAARSLTQASALLRAHVLPVLADAGAASRTRLAADHRTASRGTLIALLGALLGLLGPAGVHWWLTIRTRRILNLPIASGLVLLLIAQAVGLPLLVVSGHRVTAVEAGAQRVAQKLVEARVAAFDARGREALAVLNSTVSQSDPDWRATLATAQEALREASFGSDAAVGLDLAQVSSELTDYADAHTELVALAGSGQDARTRQQVRQQAGSADGSAGRFEEFDALSGALLARQARTADDEWAQAGAGLGRLGWLTLVAGLSAAVLGRLGLAARSREYR